MICILKADNRDKFLQPINSDINSSDKNKYRNKNNSNIIVVA